MEWANGNWSVIKPEIRSMPQSLVMTWPYFTDNEFFRIGIEDSGVPFGYYVTNPDAFMLENNVILEMALPTMAAAMTMVPY